MPKCSYSLVKFAVNLVCAYQLKTCVFFRSTIPCRLRERTSRYVLPLATKQQGLAFRFVHSLLVLSFHFPLRSPSLRFHSIGGILKTMKRTTVVLLIFLIVFSSCFLRFFRQSARLQAASWLRQGRQAPTASSRRRSS